MRFFSENSKSGMLQRESNVSDILTYLYRSVRSTTSFLCKCEKSHFCFSVKRIETWIGRT